MSNLMTMGSRWAALSARTRALLAAAAAVLAFTLAYHAAIAPLAARTKAERAVLAQNARKLAAAEAEAAKAPGRSAFAGKRLGPLSAARVVEALTEAAHRSGIRRVTFKTGATAPVDGSPDGPRAARMPVSVEIEAQGGEFANYLENLGNLPIPLAIETFEMSTDDALAPALRIRLALEVYGHRV